MARKKVSAAAELAVKMVQVLREQPSAAGGPWALADLARIADPDAAPRTVLSVVRQRKRFVQHVVVARRDLQAPLALVEDLPQLAASSALLHFALRVTRTASNHVASIAELKRKLTTKLQAPFQEAVQRHIGQESLPEGVGWLLVRNTRKLFLLDDVHTGRGAVSPAPAAETIPPIPSLPPAPPVPPPLPEGFDFARAFEEAFRRLDRHAGGHNFVNLAALRPELPCDRAAFDGGLRDLRAAGRYTLSAAEGRHGLTDAERAAGILEDGTLLLYVSRRMP